MEDYIIEPLKKDNIEECAKLANMLWNDYALGEAVKVFTEEIDKDNISHYLLKKSNEYIGFLEVSLRCHYVEGCESSPVGYIEGIYIKSEYRKMKYATKLIDFACELFKSMGCTQIASDCELENESSIQFHRGIGFEEVNRIVNFVKRIK